MVGTHHVANACCVGHTGLLVDARRHGSMAVVEGCLVGGGDSTHAANGCCVGCAWVLVDACHHGLMAVVEGCVVGAAGGCTSLGVDGCGGRAHCWCWGLVM